MSNEKSHPSSRLAAFLLPGLPAAVALASFAHGHGTLSGQGLGMVVLLAIAAGAAAGLRLLAAPVIEAVRRLVTRS